MCVNKWDGMRPKSPNSIHRERSWCHIPPVLALIGASCHLPNPIGFGGHSPPPATKTSPSGRLYSLSSSSSLLTVAHSLGFTNISRLHCSPSLSPAFIALCRSPSSSIIALCHHHLLPHPSMRVTNCNCSCNYWALLDSSFNALPFAHHIILKPNYNFHYNMCWPIELLQLHGLMCCFAMDIACCFGSVYYVHFQYSNAQPICYFFGFLLVSWWFVGILASPGTNNLGCWSVGFLTSSGTNNLWGGCAQLWAWMALASLLMREQALVHRVLH